jgi:hypothetical protein
VIHVVEAIDRFLDAPESPDPVDDAPHVHCDKRTKCHRGRCEQHLRGDERSDVTTHPITMTSVASAFSNRPSSAS